MFCVPSHLMQNRGPLDKETKGNVVTLADEAIGKQGRLAEIPVVDNDNNNNNNND